jgi:hypothetical protein
MADILSILELIGSLPTGLISLILEIACWINDLLGSPIDLSFCNVQ